MANTPVRVRHSFAIPLRMAALRPAEDKLMRIANLRLLIPAADRNERASLAATKAAGRGSPCFSPHRAWNPVMSMAPKHVRRPGCCIAQGGVYGLTGARSRIICCIATNDPRPLGRSGKRHYSESPRSLG